MQVNKTSSVNFTGIYRIPLTRQNADEVIQYILPAYRTIRHKQADFFIGENPFRVVTDKLLINLAKNSGGSPKWLKDNAELHNIDTENFIDNAIHVVTTEKDILSVFNFITKKQRVVDEFISPKPQKLSFIDKIKQIWNAPTQDVEVEPDLPQHLQILKKILDFTKKNNDDFQEFVKDKIVNLKSTDELIEKLAEETA